MDWRGYFLNQHMDWTKNGTRQPTHLEFKWKQGISNDQRCGITVAMGYRKAGWLRIMFRIVPFVPHRIVAVIDLLPFFVLSFASNKLLMLVFASSYIVLEHQENDLQRNFMEIKFVFTPRINNQMDLDFG